jgi:hypothetical protein
MNDVELSVTHLQSQYQRQKKERFANAVSFDSIGDIQIEYYHEHKFR